VIALLSYFSSLLAKTTKTSKIKEQNKGQTNDTKKKMSTGEEVEIKLLLKRHAHFAPPEDDNTWVMPRAKKEHHYHFAHLMNFFTSLR